MPLIVVAGRCAVCRSEFHVLRQRRGRPRRYCTVRCRRRAYVERLDRPGHQPRDAWLRKHNLTGRTA